MENKKGGEFLHLFVYHYLFENWEAFLAFFKPYFLLSFILGSLVRKPSLLRAGLKALSASTRALEMP